MIKFKSHAVGRIGLALTTAILLVLFFAVGALFEKEAENFKLAAIIFACLLAADLLIFFLLTIFSPTITVTCTYIEAKVLKKIKWRVEADDIEKIDFCTYSPWLLAFAFLLAGDVASGTWIYLKPEAYYKYKANKHILTTTNRPRATREKALVFFSTKKQIRKIKALGYKINDLL